MSIFKVVQWNARGIKQKSFWLQLEPFVSADFIVIQETWLSDLDYFSIPGRNVYRLDRETGRRGGGLLIAPLLKYPSSINNHLTFSSIDCEFLVIDFYIENSLFHLCNAYCPHGRYESNAQKLFDIPDLVVFCGDLNVHSRLWGSSRDSWNCSDLENKIIDGNFNLLNDGSATFKPSPDYESAIDITLCSPTLFTNSSWQVNPDLCGSDHFPIISSFNFINFRNNQENKCLKITNREAVIADINQFLNSSSFFNFHDFQKTLSASFHKHTKTVKCSGHNSPPWWNIKCSQVRAKKRRAFRAACKSLSDSDWLKYKKFRALLQKTIINEKRKFWEKTCELAVRSNSIFKILRGIKSNLSHVSSHLILNCSSGLTSDPLAQAEEFVNFLVPKINLPPIPTDLSRNKFPFINDDFSLFELKAAIKKLRCSSPGKDNIPAWIFKNLSDNLLNKILKYFNQLWSSGSIPDCWKESVVVPILKPGKPGTQINSYRPISLTSCFAKLFEHILLKRLIILNQSENFLTSRFHGFIQNRNCLTALSQISSAVKRARDDKKFIILISLDFQGAYDSIWVEGLIYKLASLGFGGRFLLWLHNFLSCRKIEVKWRNSLSSQLCSSKGVPQGCVLSPILFNYFLSDISEILYFPTLFTIYADDLYIYSADGNLSNVTSNLQKSIDSLCSWANYWRLSLSVSKTKLINFSRRKVQIPINVKLNGLQINEVKDMKILGINFSGNFSWKNHFLYLKKIGLKFLNIFKFIASPRWGAKTKPLISIFNSTIRAKLDFGSQLFSSSPLSTRKIIEPVLNSGLRIALGVPFSTPIDVLLTFSQQPSMIHRHEFLKGKFFINLISSSFDEANSDILFSYDSFGNTKTLSFLGKLVSEFFHSLKLNPSSVIVRPLSIPEILDPSTFIYTNQFQFQKKDIPGTVCNSLFNYTIHSEFKDYIVVGTDGSKADNHSCFSIVCANPSFNFRFSANKINSIFTLEALAILSSLFIFKTPQKILICTDSLSALNSINSFNKASPTIIHRILNRLFILKKKNFIIKIIWVPAHQGIVINELADSLAGNSNVIPVPSPLLAPEDIISEWKKTCKSNLETHWKQSKFFHKFSFLSPNSSYFWPQFSRWEEVLLNRLFCKGLHTNKLKFKWKMVSSPDCSVCNILEDDFHILFSCIKYTKQRKALINHLAKFNINCTSIDEFLLFTLNERSTLNFIVPILIAAFGHF